MKALYRMLKIVAVVTWFFTIAKVVFWAVIKYKYALDIKHAAAIGIIGSADGPSAIFVGSGKCFGILSGVFLSACPYIAIITTLILLAKRIWRILSQNQEGTVK